MKRIASVAGVCALMLVCAPVASAHDSVVSAYPGLDATVGEFPDTLTLEFSGNLKDDFNTVALSRMDNDEVLFSGEPEVKGREVSIAVPEGLDPQPGGYRIGFQVTSSDGHATKGKTEFAYQPDNPDNEQAPEASQAGEPDKANVGAEETIQDSNSVTESGYTWLWLLLGVFLLGGVAIAALGKRQRTETTNKRLRDLDYNSSQEGNQYNRSGETGAGYTAGDQDQGLGTAESDQEPERGPRRDAADEKQ